MISLVIISFFLDGIVLNSITPNTIFCPLFSLLSIPIIYPSFINDKNRFYIICGVLGIFYDICYANTLFLSVFLFLAYGKLVTILFNKLTVSILNTYWVGIMGIVLYRIIQALFFVIFFFSSWSLRLLIQSIFSSIILNSIYLIVFYFLAKRIRIKLRKQKYKLLKIQKSE